MTPKAAVTANKAARDTRAPRSRGKKRNAAEPASARSTTKGRSQLRPSPERVKASRGQGDESRIMVPIVDGSGVPLPGWRVARWHLLCAEKLLADEYRSKRGSDARAPDFARASAVAGQTYLSLAAKAGDDECVRLRVMAQAAGHRMRTDKSDAERWLREKLPATAAEARSRFSVKEIGHEGLRNLASRALNCLVAQDHADPVKILRRWGVHAAGNVLGSAKYWEDVDSLASEIATMLEDDESDFAGSIVRAMYRLLKLGRAFVAEKKKVRRTTTR